MAFLLSSISSTVFGSTENIHSIQKSLKANDNHQRDEECDDDTYIHSEKSRNVLIIGELLAIDNGFCAMYNVAIKYNRYKTPQDT
jgi:hypothetical protein